VGPLRCIAPANAGATEARLRCSELKASQSPKTLARHSGERRNPVKYVVRSTQNPHVVCFARMFGWIPAFAGMTGIGSEAIESL